MLNWIKEFLTPPIFLDEDKTRVASLLYLLSKIALVGAVMLIVILTSLTGDFGQRTLSASIAIPILFFELALVKKGYVRLAAYFFVLATWILGNYTTLFTGGVRDVGFGINLIIVLEAGMLISLRAALAFGVMSSLAGLGMAIAQRQGLMPPAPSDINAFTAWITESLYLIFAVGLLYLTLSYIQQSLARTKRAEARLRGIVENTPDTILEIDRTGMITLMNRNQDRFLGRQVHEFIYTNDIPKAERVIAQSFATGEKSSLEVQTYAPGDTLIWNSVRIGPIAPEGTVTSLAAIVTDITARKQAETERENLIAELETRNAELERFAYTVSHELKTPLVTIRGFLGFVEQSARTGNWERLTADLARIGEATDKMQRLLSDLLELSRIGRLMNPPEAAAFESIAQEAIKLVHGRIEARGVQVTLAPALPIVYGDRARLVEVVQNLVDNACKFMGDQPEPQITIGQRGTDRDGKSIVFVQDNGLGIDPQYHEKVFGLFDKLDAKGEGTGVGLALVKRIIEVHGGRVWVESQGQASGTTFCFTLPVSAERAP